MSAPQWLYHSHDAWMASARFHRRVAHAHFLVGIVLWLIGFLVAAAVMFIAGFIFMRLSLRALHWADERVEQILVHVREELDQL